jgi:hypothetical protein
MTESSRRLPSSLEPGPSAEDLDGFLFKLEALLPPEAEIMWISPASSVEQIISVRLHKHVIYFCGEHLSSESFFNWDDYQDPKNLQRCLEKYLKIDQAHTPEQLVLYIRQALYAVGMEEHLVVTHNQDEVTLHHASDGDFYASCGTDHLPKSFPQVQADIEELLEIQAPETADDFETFLALFQSVNANEFQSAFTQAISGKNALEVTYQKGQRRQKNNFIRLWMDASFWEKSVTRKDLVEFLTDEIKDRLDDRRLEYTLFMNQFRHVAADYPDLKYKMGLTNARIVSADRRECCFMGIRGEVAKAIKPIPQKFCIDDGYDYKEIDCAHLITESALRSYLEYDLGYACPAPLSQTEKRN